MRLLISILLVGVLAGSALAQPHKRGWGKRFPPPGGWALEKLSRMPPEERQRVLRNLPPERRKRLEERLARYNQLTPEERQKMQDRYATFRGLPPEKQDEMRALFRRFSAVPQDRRFLLHREVRRLRNLPPEARDARLASDEFKSRYTPGEQDLIRGMSRLLPPD